MADMIKKIFSSEIKTTDTDRVLEFCITTETKDRDGEVVKAEGGQFENYTKNPVVLWAHDYQSLPVGKTKSLRRENGKTLASVEFPTKDEYEYADIVYKLCKGGYLNTVSIGFIPLDVQPGKGAEPKRTYTKWELLEFSIVPVPSNPDALVSARNAGVISVKEFAAITTREHPEKKVFSQAAVRDELEYMAAMLAESGVSEVNKEVAVKVGKELLRLSGSDIPVIDKAAPEPVAVEPVATKEETLNDLQNEIQSELRKYMEVG